MKEVGKNFCLFIMHLSSFFLLLFFIFIEFQFAEGNILSIQGKEGCPYFDLKGNLSIIYITPTGGINVATVQEDNLDRISIQHIHYANNISSIRAKKDRYGKIWVAWEERESEKSDIYVAQLKNKRIVKKIRITTDQKGFNFSPSIDFSLGNDLWMTWVNYFQKKYTILVKNVKTDQIWEINSTLTFSALSPHLIVDSTSKIWLFCVGQLRNRDEILYTHFDGERWREFLSLNLYSDVPHITPSISLDFNGFPHIVWSAYDGNDYELYYSYWDGKKWGQEKRITNNQNKADTSPSISLLLDTIPIVAWVRDTNEKHEICLTYKVNDKWSSGINISEEKSITNSPKVVSLRGKIGVLWQTNTEIKTILTDFFGLQKLSFLRKRNIHFPRILTLDKDKYIGFGDSITYGIINYEAAPNKGYVPRLEKLVNDNIRESQVVNCGVPGEKTSEGLSRIGSVINGEQAKTIFLMEGTNDAKDTEISMDTAAFNMKKMSERSLNFGMTVFLASIIPKHPWEGLIKDRILELNEKIESITAELNIYFVDQFEVFIDYPGNLYSLYSDATHPNEQGYQLMAESWYAALVDTMPSIEINKTSLSFEANHGESNPSPQTFKIRNSGEGRLKYDISDNKEWISVFPESGDSRGEWNEIEVSVDISNLSPGNHQGNVTVTSDYASNSPQIMTIELTVLSPVIELDKTSLSFEGIKGESNPPPQIFKIRNSGNKTLNYQISDNRGWISASPASGDSKGEWDEIKVSVNISNLSPGNYQGNVTVTSDYASNSPQVVKIELTVISPVVELDKTSLSFEGTAGESNPSSQIFKIRNSGAGTLNYQLSADQEWISLSPENGDSKGEWDEIKVSVDISNLSPGNYQGNVTVTSDYASNSPQELTVNLAIQFPPLFQPLNFYGEKKKNRSLSQLEYLNILTWEANPKNKNIVEKYKIYLVEERNKILLKELDAQTFEYWHRKVDKDKVYKYGLTAKDIYGKESEPVYIEVR